MRIKQGNEYEALIKYPVYNQNSICIMYILFLGRMRVEKEESVQVIWVGNARSLTEGTDTGNRKEGQSRWAFGEIINRTCSLIGLIGQGTGE